MYPEFSYFYRYFGLTGSLVILAAVGISSVFYTGRKQERYSLLNHFVSELGELGVSRLAPLFNYGLVIGGLVLIPFVGGLGLNLDSLWAKLGLVAGLGACGACVAVGLLPMNKLAPHTLAAMTFFRLGLATILLFSIAIFAQPASQVVVPLSANLFGGLAVLAYSSFLILAAKKPVVDKDQDVLNPAVFLNRPNFWPLAVLEWLVFFTTMLWFLGVALTLSV